MATRRQPHRSVLDDGVVGDRGGRAKGFLHGRNIALARLDRSLKVDEQPHIGRLLEVELFDLDLPAPGGAAPVNSIEAVARSVGPNGRRQRSRLQRPLWGRMTALEVRVWQLPARQRHDAREHSYDRGAADGRGGFEEAERIAGPNDHRLDPIGSSPRQRNDRYPGSLGPGTKSECAPRHWNGQVRRVVDLQPGLGQPARVGDAVGRSKIFADVGLSMIDAIAGLQIGQTVTCQHVASADRQQPKVDDVEQELQAARERGNQQHHGHEQEL